VIEPLKYFMASNFGPIVVALFSWIVFNLIGKPLLRFFDLQTQELFPAIDTLAPPIAEED